MVKSFSGADTIPDILSTHSSQLAQKANLSDVQNISKGSPSGVYSTLSALQTAFPTGNSNIYVVTADGKWYYWSGSAWTAGGTYQASGIADGSVTYNKIQGAVLGKNLFNKDTVTNGYYVSSANGTLQSNASYMVSDYIPISPNTTYYFNSPRQNAFYDSGKNYISGTNGVYSFTTPSNASFVRVSLLTTEINTTQLEVGSTGTSYVPYTYSLNYLKVFNSSIDSVSKDKLTFNVAELKTGKNLFDKTDITNGYYVNSNGQLLANSSYFASDYIAIQSNVQYCLSPNTRQIAYYDSNKNFISYISYVANPFTTPTNAVYLRFSLLTTELNSAQLEQGSTPTSYQNFGYNIDKLLPNAQADYFKFSIPSQINIAVGRTIELYNKQICQCGNINDYHFSYSCNIGQTLKRKWTYTATADKVGSYSMTINAYDNNMVLVATATTTINVVNVSTAISTAKNILLIGDSLTNSKPWQPEWMNLCNSMFGNSKINFIGTQGTAPNMHEGRSGWTTANYVNNYSTQIILTVTGVKTAPSSKKRYNIPDNTGSHIWDVETSNLDANGNGTITFDIESGSIYTVSASGTITAVDSAGTGDSSITYSSWVSGQSNPFWNSSTSQVDFTNYLTVNSLPTPDVIQIFLGANDLSNGTGNYNQLSASYQSSINNIKTLVDKIISQLPNTKIYLALTPYWADQNGLGLNYGNSNTDFQQRLRVFTFTDMLISQFGSYNSHVSIVPLAQTFDSDYNFGTSTQAVNPRSAITETIQTGGVHPTDWLQMADTMFSHFVQHYLDS